MATSLRPDVVETHISILFFVGDRVYKVHKPVTFEFVDFARREAREADCVREVALNRRLAPDVYLGVADIQFNGAVVDHLVVMRRLPQDRRLADLLVHRPSDRSWVVPLAELLAKFHGSAARGPDISAAAGPTRLGGRWSVEFAECDRFVGTFLDEEREVAIRRRAQRWLAGRGPLLESRIVEDHVCDGHGDLQADDVYCLDDGIRVLDCLEFSDDLRYGDVAADIAFLVMDLERLGHVDAAREFADAYRRASGDHIGDSLLHHYVAAHAYVRAKVACLRAEQGDQGAALDAARFHELAWVHLRSATVHLVLVGGLPGSGKSTVATGIADAHGWRIVRSDDLRRELPSSSTGDEGLFSGRYSAEATRRVYESMLERAEELLGAGESVVLDASWTDADWRMAAASLAERTTSEFATISCWVDDATAVRRIEARRAAARDPSEATPAVRAEMGARSSVWEADIALDTSSLSPEDSVRAAVVGLTGLDGRRESDRG